MSRYVEACGGNTRKAMTLYRYNAELAQTVFPIIGFFEVALRNAINVELTIALGNEWLKDSCLPGGIFNIPNAHKTCDIISNAYHRLLRDGLYSHTKLLAEMEFGVWKYVFNELDKINTLRNRIAHHEPICFPAHGNIIYTEYIRNEYVKILSLLEWLGIDSKKYLYGLDHVMVISDKIDKLKPA